MAERVLSDTKIAFARHEARPAISLVAAKALADASLPFTLREAGTVTTIFAPETHRQVFEQVLKSPTLQLLQEATIGGRTNPQAISDRIYAENGAASSYSQEERGRLEARMWENVRADRAERLARVKPDMRRVVDTYEFYDAAQPYREKLQRELAEADARVKGLQTYFGHEPMSPDEFDGLVSRETKQAAARLGFVSIDTKKDA